MMTRRSPIHEWLDRRSPLSDDLGTMQSLALCDASRLPKLGIKGPDAARFLSDRGIDVPSAIFASGPLSDGGLVARLGADEFILEGGPSGEVVQDLSLQLEPTGGQVFRVERGDATLLLIGSRANVVLAQTCGINFQDVPQRHLVLTRVAGVSCDVLPESVADQPAFRIWVDCTYALYLWETLVEISEELGGIVVSASCILDSP